MTAMTQEEKLQLAKEWYNDPSTTKEIKSHLEELFPELKESEDERIRYELIKLMKQMSNTIVENYTTIEISTFVDWLEKQGEQETTKAITVIERDGEQWIRVCAFGEDFIIAAHNHREREKTEFTWEEACKIGTFSKKQGHIILALLDEINARLEEIGGEPLDAGYWSSSESNQSYAWLVLFGSGGVYINGKCNSLVARKVTPF